MLWAPNVTDVEAYRGDTLYGSLPPHLAIAEIITTIRRRWGEGEWVLYPMVGSRRGTPKTIIVDADRNVGFGLYAEPSRETSEESSSIIELTRLIRRQQDQLAEESERIAERDARIQDRAETSASVEFQRFREFHSEIEKIRAESKAETERERASIQQERDSLMFTRFQSLMEAQTQSFKALMESQNRKHELEIEQIKAQQANGHQAANFSRDFAEMVALRKLDIEMPEPNFLDSIARNAGQFGDMIASMVDSGMFDVISAVMKAGAQTKPDESSTTDKSLPAQIDETPTDDELGEDESADFGNPGFGQVDVDGKISF